MAYNSKVATKRRNHGSHPTSLSHPTVTGPSNPTANINPYATAPLQTVPSNGPGALYVPETYMNNTTGQSHYQFPHNATPVQHPPVQHFDPGFGTGSSRDVFHGYHQLGYSTPAPTTSLYSEHPNPYDRTGSTVIPLYATPPPFGFSGEEKYPIAPMDQDFVEKSPVTPPPTSPTGSTSTETPFPPDIKQPISTDKRPRDPHRKEIESRAADKRKSAVKRLQHVLANRTRGLPENGLANQLHMAADQLEEDGRTILLLKKENGDLKKQVNSMKNENTALKNEIQTLKAR